MMSYNLTNDERMLLQEIVRAIRAKNLKDEFIVVWGTNGTVVGFKENEGWLPFPAITKAKITALEKEQMIYLRKTSAADGDHAVYVSVTQRGYDGVDIDFRHKKATNWAMVSALIALAVFCAAVIWKLAEVASQ